MDLDVGKIDRITKRTAISNHNIRYILQDPRLPVIRYELLEEIDDLSKILPEYDSKVVVLYPSYTGEPIGHFVCFRRYYNRLYVFDSYGKQIDHYRRTGDETFIRLILNTPSINEIQYNSIPLQKESKNINTCGPWCILYLITDIETFPDIDDFGKAVKRKANSLDISTDDLCVAYINFILSGLE